MSPQVLLPIFGGQGMPSIASRNGTNDLSHLVSSPSGTLLLHTCHAVFHEELGSLDANDRENVHICAEDFKETTSILSPINKEYFENPVISGSVLLLEQSLGFLAYIEHAYKSATPFLDALKSNRDLGYGILGFSSGILSSCVAAASSSVPSFILHCVEAYKLSLWIGIRSRLYQVSFFGLSNLNSNFRPWSLMLLGISKVDIQETVERFSKAPGIERADLTAVMSDDCITVSGHPDALVSFAATLSDVVTICSTKVNALYHCATQLHAVREQVVEDVATRNIHFPALADLSTPIRSTLTGDLISSAASSGSLVELVIDMILMHPVNWDEVAAKTVRTLPHQHHQDISLLNIGLGASFVRHLESSLTRNTAANCHVLDLSNILSVAKVEVKQEPIAIVGMAVNMPGGASTVAKLWDLLKDGRSTLAEIPGDRFRYDMYTNNDAVGRSMKTTTGNFVEDVGHFDHRFFNINPREAKSMDPQQRLLLQVGYEALENAGYVPHATPTFNPDTFGCFIGSATHDYIQNLRNNIDVYNSTGTLKAFLSGRLSYCLGLSGPSVVVDTACSSSMVAIYQAARALMNKDCHAALAGGVNVISSPDMFMGLDKGHFLSPSGQCKSFDATADGYSRGEGCGVFVLKRLTDAVAENDRILGVIKGIEVNQSGRAQSITHPHASTQAALFRQLLSCSDVDPNSVNLVEAHGTGTQAGDTNEMESIRCVLSVDRTPNNPLYVTSIKPNIGHLEAASGCASLAKVLLMLRHNVIPRQISLQSLNPQISRLDRDNTVINTENVAWLPMGIGKPRIALINNFGAAGSNTALLLEEYVSKQLSRPVANGTSYVFGLSAKDRLSLQAVRSKFIEWLQNPANNGVSLLDIAYTITARKQAYLHRLAVPAATRQDLIKKLDGASIFDAPEHTNPVIFVFSGQGSQYRGMGCSFYNSSPLFKRHVDECDGILISLGFSGIISIISANDESMWTMGDAQDYQTALFSLQYALAKVWISWGVKPIAVVGHSLGEYAALVTAGVVSLKDALFIVGTRARLMITRCATMTSGMVAVSMAPAEVQNIIDSRDCFSDLSIACFNSPKDCVISGPLLQLHDFRAHVAREKNCKTTLLSFPYAGHSPAMAPLAEDLVALRRAIKTDSSRFPFISTVLGRVIFPGDQNFPPVDYFARQCVDPVKFSECIESYLANPIFSGEAIWLEIGPHPTVLPMLRSFPSLSSSKFLTSLRKGQDSWTTLSNSLSSLYVAHYPIDWRQIFNEVGSARCVDLPSYPFAAENFWVPFTEDVQSGSSVRHGPKFALIRTCSQFPDNDNNKTAIFQTPISQVKIYIEGHQVGGTPLCPASVYLEMIYAAVSLSMQYVLQSSDGLAISLRNVNFLKALTWNLADDVGQTTLMIIIDLPRKSFAVKSRVHGAEAETLHASGEYYFVSSVQMKGALSLRLPSTVLSINEILTSTNDQKLETFSKRTIYQVIFPRVVEYSKDFQSLQYLTILPHEMKATATMKLDPALETGAFVVHPVFLDTLIHMAGFVANLNGGLNDAYICSEIGSVQILAECLTDKTASYVLYCTLSKHSTQNDLLAESYAYLDGQDRVLVAQIKGIRFQRLRLSGLKAGLASISGKYSLSSARQHEVDKPSGSITSTNIISTVREIIAKACEINPDDISFDQELESIGIDSLMRLELAYDLSRVFSSFGYCPQEISMCRTIMDIVVSVSASQPTTSPNYHVYQEPPRTPANIPSVYSSPRTLVHYKEASPPVRRIFAHILDIKEDAINDDTELASLGFDSLASMEARHTLKQRYNLDVSNDLLSPKRTVRDIERQVTSLEPSVMTDLGLPHHLSRNPFTNISKALSFNRSLSLLQNSNSELAPLVLIHDGSGLTVSYERISTLNRRVWAISNPRFFTSDQWNGVIEMARMYADLIFNEIEGPVILGGWSFGGVVAIEVAKQLSLRSTTVKGVILIDTPNPLSHVPLAPSLIDYVLDTAQNQDLELVKFCKLQFTMNAQLLAAHFTQMAKEPDFPSIVFLRSTEPYNPPIKENVPAWLSDRTDLESISSGWDAISGGRVIKTLDISGHHFGPFDPQNVAFVSKRIAEASEFLDKWN